MNIHALSIPCRNGAVQAFIAGITERVEAFFCAVMSNGVYLYLSSLVSNLVSDFAPWLPICSLFKLQ